MKREGKENARGEVNKEGGEGEGREGKSLEYSVYTFHQEPHIQRLTYDGEDEGVCEMVVERQLHVVLSQTQCSSRGHKRREDVERLLRN